MEMIILIVAIIVIAFLILILLLNRNFRKSNYISNKYIELSFYKKDISNNLDVAIFGSTYSLYAFQAIRELYGNKANNFSLNAESLELDKQLLKKYIGHIKEGGFAIFTLAPCVCYYSYDQSPKYNSYQLLSYDEIPNFSRKQKLKYKFPLVFDGNLKQNIKHTLVDDIYVKTIDEFYPSTITVVQAERNMKGMAEGWKKLFHIENLKEKSTNEENEKNLEHNAHVVTDMIRICSEHGVTPVFVMTPISKYLNQYFGDDFLNNGIMKMVDMTDPEHKVLFLDYRKDSFFQNNISLFADGGFRINYEGSRIFCKMVMKRIYSSN